MPLTQERKQFKDDAEGWFQRECLGPRHVQDDAEWNMRHLALAKVADAVRNWIIEKPEEYGWHAPIAEATLCEFLFHEDAMAIPASDAKSFRIAQIRLKSELLSVEFDALNKKWQRETRHLSLISKQITHPAYLRIIGMGESAIPLLLGALRDKPAHWFAALRATSNTDPSSSEDNPSQAREAWIRWGISEGYID